MQTKAWLLTALALPLAALPLSACFPEFGFSSADAGGGDGGTRPEGGGDGGSSFQTVRVDVPGAAFDYCPPANGNWEDPWFTATLTHGFYVDTTEVTVARFREWEKTRAVPCDDCTLDPGGPFEATMRWKREWTAQVSSARSCLGTRTTADGDPINCVTWYEALAFCFWDGQKRLPVHSELSWAGARGARRQYPWGDDPPPDCARAVLSYDGGACAWPVPAGSTSSGKTADGIFDLFASVGEWTWNHPEENPPGTASCVTGKTDWTGPPPGAIGETKWVVGASFLQSAGSVYDHDVTYADLRKEEVGFRCVRTRL